ncbi:MAG: D-alanyl-D-alanine carboxypeptidase family protein [Clostridia bacterium]
MVKLSKFSKKFICKGIIVISIITFSILFGFIPISHNVADASGGSSFIVANCDTMDIYKEFNSHQKLPMASTTKIVTALIALENCKLNEKVVIPKEAVGIEGSSIYLRENEEFTLEELLYGLMLRSGNDASVAIAIHTAGSLENFINMMNCYAEIHNLSDTHFTNPNGLPDDEHYTSAYDLLKISCIAMQNEQFKKIVGTKTISIGKNESTRYLKNKNKILTELDGGNGIKTGYTKKAGRCLVSSCERDGVCMVCVVLNRGDMWGESKHLLNYAFECYLEN